MPCSPSPLRSLILLAAMGLTAAPAAARAPAASTATDRLIRLGPHSWAWIADEDRSANGTLLVGRQAALIVDPGLTPLHMQRFLTAARRVTDRPIRYAVLTHWHPDHSLGALCLPAPELTLLAHPRTAQALAERGAMVAKAMANAAPDAEERASLAACQPRVPTETIAHKRSIDLGGLTVDVFHPGAAHTPGDLVVWTPNDRVLATGDLFLHDSSPSMGEGSVKVWIDALAELARFKAARIVPGHFAVGTVADLKRFRDYLVAARAQAEAGLKQGRSLDAIAAAATLPAYNNFRQYPNYQATIADNVRTIARELALAAGRMPLLAALDVGRAPHQIVFDPSGERAFVAVAESDRIGEIDVATRRIVSTRIVTGTPLGVAVLPGTEDLLATRFVTGSLVRINPSGNVIAEHSTGAGPSLLVGPLRDGRVVVSVESAARLLVVDPSGALPMRELPTGKRPFPPAVTRDARTAFVPNYDDGTVTVLDLPSGQTRATIPVGSKPSGGALIAGDREYAVAVRGEDRIAFIDTERLVVTGSVREGIGSSPFSVVVAPDGRRAFINNTQSHDISVLDLGTSASERRVTARIPVGQIPIVIAVHPSGETLWVACEGSHELDIIALPQSGDTP